MMRWIAMLLAGALIGLVPMSQTAGAVENVPSPAPQSGDAGAQAQGGEGSQAQPAPRRKPSPPVPGQSARGPAFKEECVWIGKRVVSLLARDDAMAAGDFMPFYTRFKCPEGHVAEAFGCVVTSTEPSENEALADRIDACWDNPDTEFARAPKPDQEDRDAPKPDGT